MKKMCDFLSFGLSRRRTGRVIAKAFELNWQGKQWDAKQKETKVVTLKHGKTEINSVCVEWETDMRYSIHLTISVWTECCGVSNAFAYRSDSPSTCSIQTEHSTSNSQGGKVECSLPSAAASQTMAMCGWGAHTRCKVSTMRRYPSNTAFCNLQIKELAEGLQAGITSISLLNEVITHSVSRQQLSFVACVQFQKLGQELEIFGFFSPSEIFFLAGHETLIMYSNFV